MRVSVRTVVPRTIALSAACAAVAGCGTTTIVKTVREAPRRAVTDAPADTATATATTRASAPPGARLGDALTVAGRDTTLLARVTSVLDPLPVGEYDSPDSGNRFVGVMLAIENTGSRAYSDALSNGATLILQGDQQASNAIVSGGPCGNGFGADVKIAPGDKRVGCLAFEVPGSVGVRSFQLTPDSGFSEDTAQWDIDSHGSGGDGASSSDAPSPTANEHASDAGYRHCDANIQALAGTTTCGFAQNVFFEYWTNDGADTLRVYSPQTRTTYDTTCAKGAMIVCTTDDGGAVRFPQTAIDNYSQSQADAYAANHDVGP